MPRLERVDKDVSPLQVFVFYWPEKLLRGSCSNWVKGDSDSGIFDFGCDHNGKLAICRGDYLKLLWISALLIEGGPVVFRIYDFF